MYAHEVLKHTTVLHHIHHTFRCNKLPGNTTLGLILSKRLSLIHLLYKKLQNQRKKTQKNKTHKETFKPASSESLTTISITVRKSSSLLLKSRKTSKRPLAIICLWRKHINCLNILPMTYRWAARRTYQM